jgi:hypothetical protein
MLLIRLSYGRLLGQNGNKDQIRISKVAYDSTEPEEINLLQSTTVGKWKKMTMR